MRDISGVPGRQSRRGHKNNPSTASFEVFEKEKEPPSQKKEQDGNADTENIHEMLHTSEPASVCRLCHFLLQAHARQSQFRRFLTNIFHPFLDCGQLGCPQVIF